MSITIRPLEDTDPEPAQPRRMRTSALHARLLSALEDVVVPSLVRWSDVAPPDAVARGRRALAEFPELYDRRPVRDNSGGSGFNDSLWLFVLARMISPERIVESGVHKGHSTWLFRQACPTAEILSFDVTLRNRIYIDETAQYFGYDWTESELESSLGIRDLIFFDDHISHARRLHEAQVRGFRLLLLDDNLPATALYATGGPPLPTLTMILDPDLDANRPIEWTRNGKIYEYLADKKQLISSRALLARHEVLPELAEITRFSLGSRLTLVELKRSD